MAARKAGGGADKSNQVRKSLMVDGAKLEQARKVLGVDSDAEALRLALDHLLSHHQGATGGAAGGGEEE